MIKKAFAKLLLSALVVSLYLAAGYAIARDLHDLNQPPPISCPICSASQVISFSEHTIPVLPPCASGFSLISHPGSQVSIPIAVCLTQYAYRAPPTPRSSTF